MGKLTVSALGCSLEVRRVGVAVDTIPVTCASPSDLYRTPEGSDTRVVSTVFMGESGEEKHSHT